MDVKGVPVSIDATDPNGNLAHIGDAVTDMSGTFGFTWTPEIAGEYKVTATFAGDDSYGSSWAQTYATVVEATSTPSTQSEISFDSINSTVTTTMISGVVAISSNRNCRPFNAKKTLETHKPTFPFLDFQKELHYL